MATVGVPRKPPAAILTEPLRKALRRVAKRPVPLVRARPTTRPRGPRKVSAARARARPRSSTAWPRSGTGPPRTTGDHRHPSGGHHAVVARRTARQRADAEAGGRRGSGGHGGGAGDQGAG